MKKEKTQTEPTPSPADLRNFVQQVKAASIRLSEKATTIAAGLDGDSERGLKETVLKLDSACDAFWDAVFGAETELRFHEQAWFARNKLSGLVILDYIFFNPDRREFWIKDGGDRLPAQRRPRFVLLLPHRAPQRCQPDRNAADASGSQHALWPLPRQGNQARRG